MVCNAETEYLGCLREILDNEMVTPNRTGVDTISVFGTRIRHDFSEGFPLLTTKRVFFKGVLHELLWFLKGTEDPSYLIENNVRIWDEWMVEKDGKKSLPHTYGVKWRNFHGFDQINYVINEIKTNPDSRRILFSAWDAANVENCALPWCHLGAHFKIIRDEYKPPSDRPADGRLGDISMIAWQRSSDFFLGCPFNQASYSLLLYMIAEITNYRPKSMVYNFHDSHIYVNHLDQVRLQLSRQPYPLPKLKLRHRDSIDDFIYDDFEIVDYKHHPTIKAEVAV